MNTGDRKVVNLTISICELENGGVESTHDFATPEDEAVASKMESGGARQIAYGLFSEALLRELYIDVILQLQNDPTFLETYRDATGGEKDHIEKILGAKAHRIMDRNLARMSSTAAKSVLKMLLTPGGSGG